MRIKQKISQHRRDFRAIYVCDFCGHEVEDYGYDDAYFHAAVIPAMECGSCGKSGGSASSAPEVPAGVTL